MALAEERGRSKRIEATVKELKQSRSVLLSRAAQTNRTTPACCVHLHAASCHAQTIVLSQTLRHLPDLRHQFAPATVAWDQGSSDLRWADRRAFLPARKQIENLVFDGGLRQLIGITARHESWAGSRPGSKRCGVNSRTGDLPRGREIRGTSRCRTSGTHRPARAGQTSSHRVRRGYRGIARPALRRRRLSSRPCDRRRGRRAALLRSMRVQRQLPRGRDRSGRFAA